MEDAVDFLHRCAQDVAVQDITAEFEDPDARVPQRHRKVFFPPSCKVIVNADLADVLLEELIDSVRADQSTTPNHEKTLPGKIHHGTHIGEGRVTELERVEVADSQCRRTATATDFTWVRSSSGNIGRLRVCAATRSATGNMPVPKR